MSKCPLCGGDFYTGHACPPPKEPAQEGRPVHVPEPLTLIAPCVFCPQKDAEIAALKAKLAEAERAARSLDRDVQIAHARLEAYDDDLKEEKARADAAEADARVMAEALERIASEAHGKTAASPFHRVAAIAQAALAAVERGRAKP